MFEENVKKLILSGRTISTMESCTGGMLATTITNVSGASDIYPGGFVTYSNRAKVHCGVPAEVIETYGVYSKETAAAMAKACADAYGTEIGVGITGSMGRRDPNNPDSVPGQVYCCIRMGEVSREFLLELPDSCETREEMKLFVVGEVLKRLTEGMN